MNKILIILLCGLLNQHYSKEFLHRFSDSSIMAGYLAVPVSSNRFILIENDIMRSRVYYEHYSYEFLSYEQFLDSMMNDPGSIPFCKLIGICKTNKMGLRIAKESNDFERFKAKYLQQIDSSCSSFRIKGNRRRKEKQILKICFDNGLYLYWNDYAACWIIREQPQPAPPF